MTRATLYERIGPERITALAQAWHDRATADPVVGHAFSHGFNPDHVHRIVAYWAQAWGGPSVYTDTMGDESGMVRMHSGDGEHDEMDERAEECFLAAAHDVGLAPDMCDELLAYWRWATVHVNAYPDADLEVPDGMLLATWSGVRELT
jgi:hemoglobin